MHGVKVLQAYMYVCACRGVILFSMVFKQLPFKERSSRALIDEIMRPLDFPSNAQPSQGMCIHAYMHAYILTIDHIHENIKHVCMYVSTVVLQTSKI